ncbi:hypothetical protein HY734_01380 [Candidatus Uhrbacteria bacterium]|nr:hypothetical protein [Candidatus Uhrbacteria bacterium]
MAADMPNTNGSSPASSAQEPLIFTMPEPYRGLAASQRPSPSPSSPSIPPPSKPLVPPSGPVQKSTGKGGRRRTRFFVWGGIGLFLALAGAAAYVFIALRPIQIVRQEPVPTPSPIAVKKEEPKVTSPVTVPVPTKEEPKTSSPFPTGTQPGRDGDSDGLTDAEEVLYGTQAGRPDTDADGYLDGNEVFNGYNPKGTAPLTLFESGLVKAHEAPPAYRILYPSPWLIQAFPQDPLRVVFSAPSGETFAVSVQAKDPSQTLGAWYASTNPGKRADELVPSVTKNGYPALTAPDHMTAYVDGGALVILVGYAVGTKSTVDYLQTFQMMVNSLSLLAAAPL